MRITILVVGSHGDMQPLLALGLGLKEVGHTVRLATHQTFREIITTHGLEFFSVEGNPRDMLAGEQGQSWLESGQNPIRFARQGISILEPLLDRMLTDSWLACQDADAIIYATFAIGGYHIAEKLGIPAFSAFLQPVLPTRSFANIGFAQGRDLGGPLNWLTHLAGEQLYWQIVRRSINRWRVRSLNLKAIPLTGLTGRMRREQLPVLNGYSPAVLPKPPDWDDWIQVTGYWFLDQVGDWQPPAELGGFLAAGPPPIYIGFGSMTPRNAADLTSLAIAALKQTGQRGILAIGWGGLTNLPDGVLPNDDLIAIGSVPHDWLFPQMAAVVHHGGAGTTAAGLRAGTPTIIVPFFFDQPFWGRRVAQLRVGPNPIPHQKLTVDNLATAIRQATLDPAIRQNAVALGRTIRTEDGVSRAVEVIQRRLVY